MKKRPSKPIRPRPTPGIDQQKRGLEALAEWKTQLAALVAAPFVGIGFVFDFLLRAKDFPELASAMWAIFGFFVGVFLFFLCLTCAAVSASALGAYERDLDLAGWLRFLATWVPRLFVMLACLALLFTGFWALSATMEGFKTYVAPYVEWLKVHAVNTSH